MRIIKKKISLNDFRSKVPGLTPSLVDSWTVSSAFTNCDSVTTRYYDYGEAVSAAYEMGLNENEVIYSAVCVDFSDEDIKTKYPNGNYGLIPLSGEACVPTYEINSAYTEEWGCDFIYYPQVLKYIDLYFKYSGYTNVNECSGDTDCCVCADYFRLGGNTVFSGMPLFINESKCGSCDEYKYPPYINLDIMLTNSIDDLGEMSILSEEYVGGVEYEKISSGDTDTKSVSGAVVNNPYTFNNHVKSLTTPIVSFSASTKILVSSSGSTYKHTSEFENEFEPSVWVDYSKYYRDSSGSSFSAATINSGYVGDEFSDVSGVSEYAFSPFDDAIIYNTEKSALTRTYDIVGNENGIFLINGTIYDVNKGYVIAECGDIKWYAPLEKEGNLYLFRIDGKRYFANSSSGTFNSDCNDISCSYNKFSDGKYIYYNNKFIDVDSETGSITLSSEVDEYIPIDKTYYKLDGYFDVDTHRIYVSGGSRLVIPNEFDISSGTSDNRLHGEQRFSDLKSEDFGFSGYANGDSAILEYSVNWIPINVVSGYAQSKLELLRRTEVTVDDLGNPLPGYFSLSGDVSSSSTITSYNRPYEGCQLNPLYEEGYVSGLYRTEDGTLYGNILESIEPAISSITSASSCSFTYYIGAKLSSGFTYVSGGVKYVDTIEINPDAVTNFYMADGSSFQVKYYDFKPNIRTIHNDDYDSDINMNMSYFEIPSGRSSYFDRADEDYIIAPVMRKEYDYGASTPQNIEGDIYIDRGVNSAFEKHLKLQEIKDMESLENYGNSWFKINSF